MYKARVAAYRGTFNATVWSASDFATGLQIICCSCEIHMLLSAHACTTVPHLHFRREENTSTSICLEKYYLLVNETGCTMPNSNVGKPLLRSQLSGHLLISRGWLINTGLT